MTLVNVKLENVRVRLENVRMRLENVRMRLENIKLENIKPQKFSSEVDKAKHL